MKFGMTNEQYSLLEALVIEPLKSYNCKVYIFGSRARATNHPHSDVDLLYALANKVELPIGFLSKIKEDIENSRFPFIVDFVNENELAESYRESILSNRIEL